MLVSVAGLGSLWRRRFERNPDDSHRFGRGVYYNTTGMKSRGQFGNVPKSRATRASTRVEDSTLIILHGQSDVYLSAPNPVYGRATTNSSSNAFCLRQKTRIGSWSWSHQSSMAC